MENYLIIFIIAVVAVAILITVFIIKKNQDPRIIWKKIYKKWFNLEKDFSRLKIPKNYNPKKHLAIIGAKGLTMNEVVIAMRKKFEVCLHAENLDQDVNRNDRTTKDGDYILLFNRNIKSDEEFKNLSAAQLKTMNHKGITLMERFLLEILYFNKNKKHLEIKNITLCSGSRRWNGDVPCVGRYSVNNEFYVDCCPPTHHHDSVCSKVVVS